MTVDFIYSPDDDGWYARDWDTVAEKTRTTVRIYRTKEAVKAAIQRGTLRWEAWR